VDARRTALAEVGKHCDVQERMRIVPPSAVMRGLYVRSIEDVLARAGCAEPYRAMFPERHSALGWYPIRDFLEKLTIAAGILRGPERVHEGMLEIGKNNAHAFSDGVLGRVMLRLLSREPRKLLKQAIAGRRQSAKPARWELSFPDERTAVMAMTEEYSYIESYYLGAAQGTFEAVGIPVQIACVLDDPYTGRHIIRW
jgi:uncharacterized protein (TIGR02265 family)